MIEDKTYHRLLRTVMAEKIMNDCSVYFNMGQLSSIISEKRLCGEKIDDEVIKFYKILSKNKGFISTKYNSRNKVTFRMFTEKGYPNFITLSNKDLIQSIESRYGKNGILIEIDYSGFEYRIFKSILNLNNFPNDFHSETEELLCVSRDEAKKLNNMVFYGSITEAWKKRVLTTNGTEYNLKKYLHYIRDLKKSITKFMIEKQSEYEDNGFVINYYGRKIYPNKPDAIFNNIVQSTGSEILIESVIKLKELIKNKNINIIFHRFDSLFFDSDINEIKENLNLIIYEMENVCEGIPLKVDVKVGRSLIDMKGIK